MNIPDNWKWVDREAEGPCQACFTVCIQDRMPDFGDAPCHLCRADQAALAMTTSLRDARADRDRLEKELETARRRISELEDDLYAARTLAS